MKESVMLEVFKTGEEISLSIKEIDILLGLLNNESLRLYEKAVAELKEQNKKPTYVNLRDTYYMKKNDIVEELWDKIFDLKKALKDKNN